MSVTPIRGAGRPEGYYLADGTRVPGVTTITGRGKNSDGLIHAAKKRWHEAGRQGLPFSRDAYWGSGDALGAGNITHQWIEDTLHGSDLTPFPAAPDETYAQALAGYEAFLEWREQFKPEIVETETPLISEEYRFGGTLDAVAIVADKHALFDWKTSNATYGDYIAQVAAYRQLTRERDGDAAPNRAFLLRVGKTYADFHYHSWPESVLDIGWRWFLSAQELYRTDYKLKKLAA